jgi:hypothetical protein
VSALPDVYQFLAAGLRDDPLLCLAQAVSWFDPLWSDTEADDTGDDGSLSLALHVCRDFFPSIYAQVVDVLHHGATYDDLDRLICAEISRQGIPLDSLEEMGYGIPMPAYGAALNDPEFYSHHPDVLPVLEMFGIEPDGEAYQVDVPERTYTAGQRLSDSLVEHSDEHYRQVGHLLGWLFSCTGNSSVDYDWETLGEFQPLTWEPDDMEFAAAIIREADEIMAAAQTGLELVHSNATLRNALQDNLHRLYHLSTRQTQKEKKKHDPPRLCWPPLDGGLTGTTEPDAGLLQLRRDAA